jgi:hypothetical protein
MVCYKHQFMIKIPVYKRITESFKYKGIQKLSIELLLSFRIKKTRFI